ncbi:unnamed protein product [Dovyalis caffra]|uniref:Uncharacterized protein n=1 Tax=Dovyalis caffra TaxID=77055 RepID=A0AAV1QQN1_9ROSI|nr:unnamed protein product [Dovyalis caffra]
MKTFKKLSFTSHLKDPVADVQRFSLNIRSILDVGLAVEKRSSPNGPSYCIHKARFAKAYFAK